MGSNVRTNEKWDVNFTIAKEVLELTEKHIDDKYYLEQFAILQRNPVIFDNNTKETTLLLNYKIPNPEGLEETKDHLLGISNAVLYIIKSQLYKNWNTVDDFKKTIQALQVTVVCPKALNDGGFKTWIFDYNNIDICIQWNEKLKNHGIYDLINDKGEEKSVDTIWCEWFFKYKKYLV
jgi:hypothetical protein